VAWSLPWSTGETVTGVQSLFTWGTSCILNPLGSPVKRMDTNRIPSVLWPSANMSLGLTCSSGFFVMSSVSVSVNFFVTVRWECFVSLQKYFPWNVFFVSQKCHHCCKDEFAMSQVSSSTSAIQSHLLLCIIDSLPFFVLLFQCHKRKYLFQKCYIITFASVLPSSFPFLSLYIVQVSFRLVHKQICPTPCCGFVKNWSCFILL